MTAAGPGNIASTDFSFVNYHSPGVYSEAVNGPLISVFNTTPTSVGIFGQTRGYQIATESILIPPDGGGTTSTLTAPVVAGASLIYTANSFTDGTSVKIDIGDVAEAPRTVTNQSAINTTMSSASNAGDATIKTAAAIGIGSTITIDSGTNTETRTVTNSVGLSSNLSISSPSGATTIYTPISYDAGTNLVIEPTGNLENRAVTAVSGGTATTLSASVSAGAASISTPVTSPVGSLLQIDTGGSLERHLVTAVTTGVSTTSTVATNAGATSVYTAAQIPVGSSLTIDTGGLTETRTVSASTAATSTTLAANSSVGATSISVNGAVANGALVVIDTGGSQESRTVTAVTGTGPYTLSVPALTYSHSSGATVSVPNTATVTALTNAHASGVTVTTPNTMTLDAALTSAHSSGAAVLTLYALTVAPLAYAHVQGVSVVAPNVGPYTLSVSALAKAHVSGTTVSAPPGLSLSSPLTYSHFTGASVIGSGTVPVPSAYLSQTGVDTTSLVVRDPITGLVYTQFSDYTVNAVTGISGVFQGPDSHYSLTRLANGNITASKVVQVSYHYTNANYFTAKAFYTYNDLTDAYGPALDANGNIVSELSFAAGFAFLNGATRIVAAACTNPGNNQSVNYQNALDQLKSDTSVGVVVSANGNQALHNMIKVHVEQESVIKAERRAIVGVDGSVTPQTSQMRIAAANAIYNSRVAMVSPATVYWYNPILNTVQVIGGHYMAAALAGIAVSINPAKPLTREVVNGFVGVAEKYSETQKDVETQGGLMVLEQSNQGNIRVRHGVTTNFTSLLSREWTILGQQDAMVQAMRNYLDNDGIIGQVIDDLTLYNVRASAINALESLTNSLIILGYRNVAVRELQSNPDVVEVSFEWRPAIPLNYILLRFAVNIQSIGIDSFGAFAGPLDRSITGPV